MADGWNGVERRKHPRLTLKGQVKGKIHTVASAPIINLSLTGALLEVPCTLRVGAVYTMRLAFDQAQALEVKAQVVRSYVHGFDRNDKGETVIKYRAAVQFHTLPDAHQVALQQLLQGVEKMGLRAELQAN
jgi:hypothetical protein